jgi:hypothetical protein
MHCATADFFIVNSKISTFVRELRAFLFVQE